MKRYLYFAAAVVAPVVLFIPAMFLGHEISSVYLAKHEHWIQVLGMFACPVVATLGATVLLFWLARKAVRGR